MDFPNWMPISCVTRIMYPLLKWKILGIPFMARMARMKYGVSIVGCSENGVLLIFMASF